MSISSLMTNVIYVCLSVDSCIHMPFQYNFVTERTAACTSILLAKKPKCPHDILESFVHPQFFIAICRYSSRYFIQTIQLCLIAGHNSHTRISKPITRAILQFFHFGIRKRLRGTSVSRSLHVCKKCIETP